MKRGLTLAGGIIGTVVNAVMSGLLALAAIAMLGLTAGIAGSGDSAAGAVAGAYAVVLGGIMMIMVAFAVTALVLNAVAITAWNGDAAKYRKRRGVVITAIVFNLLLVLYYIYNVAVAGANLIAIVESVIFILALAATSVFYIVDLCLEKKRLAQAQPTEQPAQE